MGFVHLNWVLARPTFDGISVSVESLVWCNVSHVHAQLATSFDDSMFVWTEDPLFSEDKPILQDIPKVIFGGMVVAFFAT